ncbi:flagellar motor switch phosphatase FliY [Desulfoscipio gibsoniae]
MSDTKDKMLQQDDIDAMLKAAQGSGEREQSEADDQGLGQDDIDAMLKAAQGSGEQEQSPAADQGLSQDEINALFNTGEDGGYEQLDDVDVNIVDDAYENKEALSDDKMQSALTSEEKDALGEIGNISMGSSATTLSQLLNKRVQITSPKVIITRKKDFLKEFNLPYLIIKVQFREGLSGYNVLVIKLRDAMVMANLMMGGDGTDLPEKITDLEISAASEAMNQMIGTASTSLADMLERSINILPPETNMVMETDKMNVDLPFDDPIVVIYFRMIIDGLLDTNIMQVIDIHTAREQTNLLWEKFGGMEDVETEPPMAEPSVKATTDVLEKVTDRPMQLPDDNAVKAAQEQDNLKTTDQSYDKSVMTQVDSEKLNLLLDIPLKVSVVLGSTKKQINEVLHMTPGAIVELETLVDEPVDILINGKLVARGEVVVVNENFGVKITSIVSTRERINSLK